jgi:hypothetical protein
MLPAVAAGRAWERCGKRFLSRHHARGVLTGAPFVICFMGNSTDGGDASAGPTRRISSVSIRRSSRLLAPDAASEIKARTLHPHRDARFLPAQRVVSRFRATLRPASQHTPHRERAWQSSTWLRPEQAERYQLQLAGSWFSRLPCCVPDLPVQTTFAKLPCSRPAVALHIDSNLDAGVKVALTAAPRDSSDPEPRCQQDLV